MKIKVFADTADLKVIKRISKKKIVDGFTTNPSLMRVSGAKNYKSYSFKLINSCKGKPISLEVFSDDHIGMLKQARKIALWGKNVYVKIPVVNSKNKFMGNVIKRLSHQTFCLQKLK